MIMQKPEPSVCNGSAYSNQCLNSLCINRNNNSCRWIKLPSLQPLQRRKHTHAVNYATTHKVGPFFFRLWQPSTTKTSKACSMSWFWNVFLTRWQLEIIKSTNLRDRPPTIAILKAKFVLYYGLSLTSLPLCTIIVHTQPTFKWKQ